MLCIFVADDAEFGYTKRLIVSCHVAIPGYIAIDGNMFLFEGIFVVNTRNGQIYGGGGANAALEVPGAMAPAKPVLRQGKTVTNLINYKLNNPEWTRRGPILSPNRPSTAAHTIYKIRNPPRTRSDPG
jgi:hypothetical protein